MSRVVTLTVNPTLDYSVEVGEVVPFDKLRCSSPLREAGGGGLNVARVVSGFGGDVFALFCAGGLTGRILEELVDRHGVPRRSVQVMEGTRENFSAMETSTGRQFRFVLPGPHLSEAEWRSCLAALEEELQRDCAYLVTSGSLAPGVPADFHAQVARTAKQHGVRVVLDTSQEPLRLALAEGVYLVKPNRREMAQLTSGGIMTLDELAASARELVDRGAAEIVALTLGPEGAICAWADGLLHAATPPVEVRTTIGAGDSFVAGMTWALAQGMPVEEAFRWGVASGTAAVTQAGMQLSDKATAAALLEGVVTAPLR